MKKMKALMIIELVCALFLCASCRGNDVIYALYNLYKKNEKITLEYNENYSTIYDYSQYGQKIILELTDDYYQVKINGNLYQRDSFEFFRPYNFLVLDDGFLLMDKNYFVFFDQEGKEKGKCKYEISEKTKQNNAIAAYELLNLQGNYFIATRHESEDDNIYSFYNFVIEGNQVKINNCFSLDYTLEFNNILRKAKYNTECYLNLGNISYFELDNYIFTYQNDKINLLCNNQAAYFDWNDFTEDEYTIYYVDSILGNQKEIATIVNQEKEFINVILEIYKITQKETELIYEYDIGYTFLQNVNYAFKSKYIYICIGSNYIPPMYYMASVQYGFLAFDITNIKIYSVDFINEKGEKDLFTLGPTSCLEKYKIV